MDLQKITQMLEAFPRPDIKYDIPQTFLEIAGYPHLENVASNILEFFFDTQAEHQFETLFLESLLETAKIEFNPADLDVDSTQREAFTEANTRLDLVIGTSTLLIGIENKLFHELNNDLGTYEKHLRVHSNGRKVICILLSLYPIGPTAGLDKFISITYSAFFENIRKNMGRFLVEANQRYVPFLFDFMQTVEHLQQEQIMSDQEFRTWVVENHNEIKSLLREIRRYKRHLRDQVKFLQTLINIEKHQASGTKIIAWLYEPTDLSVARALVYDFVISDNLKFGIDVFVHPDRWEITVASRSPTPIESVKEFLQNDPSIRVSEKTEKNRIWIGNVFEYGADRNLIASQVQSLIDKIVLLYKNTAR